MSITAKVTLEATQTLSLQDSFSREGVHVGGNFANYSTSPSIHRLGRVIEDFSQEESQDTFSSLDNTPVTIEEFYIEYQTLAIEQGFTVVLKLNGTISNTGWETIEPPLGDFFLYRDEATFSTNYQFSQSTYTWNFPGTQTEVLQLFRQFSSDTGLVNADNFDQFAILSYKFYATKVFPTVTEIQLKNYFHSFNADRATSLYENTQNGHYCQVRSYGTFNGLDMFTDEKISIVNFLDKEGASLSSAIPNSIRNAQVTVVTTNCIIESQGSMNNTADPTIIRPDQPGAFEAEVTFKYNVVAQGNCEEYTPTSGTAATTNQQVRKILTVRGLTFDHRRNTHELGSFSTIPTLLEWTESSTGHKTFGVISNEIHQHLNSTPYLFTQGTRWTKNLSEREHVNMFTTQSDFRSYNVPEDGPVQEFFIEDFSSSISPDIYEDSYRGTTANCRIVLRMSGRQPNSGWESLYVQRKYLGLNRADAVYNYISRTSTGVPDGVTEWYWYRQLSLREYWHLFSTQDAGSDGATRGNRAGLNSLKTVYFSGKSVFNRHTHILQKDMGDLAESLGQGYNVGPELLDSNDVLPLGFEIDGTAITGATYIPQDTEKMNSTFTNLGPTIRSTENCRVYGCVESPEEINYTATGAYFKVNEHIIGASAPSTVEEEVEWSQKLTNRKILSKDGTFKGTIINANYSTGLFSGIVADIDFNGNTDALTDGLLLLRYLFGLTGSVLIDNAIAEDAKRRTADQIEAYLADPLIQEYLDFDNSGALDALTDGLLLLRYLFGLTGLSLINNAVFTDGHGNPSATTEEVTQNLVDVTNTFIVLGSDLTPYTGDEELGTGDGNEANQSTITFTPDIDSTRSVPAHDDDLYIELRPGDELNNITAYGAEGGSSTFRMKEWELAQKVTKIGTIPNVADTASLHMKYGAPMLLLTSINPGAYQASLDVHCDNNGSSFNDFKAKFTVQGMAGPTKTVNIVNRIEDPGTPETVVESIDLSDTGDILKVNITDITDRSKVTNYSDGQEGWSTTHDELRVEAVNCTVSRQDREGESISSGGPYSAMIIPHAGGERYRATFTRQHQLHKKKTFIIEGTVRASTKEHQITYEDPLSTTQFDQVSNIPQTVQGSNLKLVFKLNTDYQQTARRARVSSLRGLYCTAEFLPDSSYGGHMVRSSGPLKLKDDTVTDIIFDSAVFQPTAPTFQCAVRLTINFPETQYDSAITRQYTGTWIGSYEGDYGLETVSAQGKTRMNTNTLPLKFVSSASGALSINYNGNNPGADVFESHEVINVEDLDNGFAGGLYSDHQWNPATDNINTNPPMYQFIHSFPAREQKVQSYYTVYYEGSKVIDNHKGLIITPKKIGYSWEFLDPPNSNILGGWFTGNSAILEEAETEDLLTQATYTLVPRPFEGINPWYQDDFNDYYRIIRRSHTIPLNVATLNANYYLPTNAPLFNNEDSYAIINNAPYSMVSGEQQVNNNRYKITITDWDQSPEYANFGSQHEVLRVNGNDPLRYSLQILKIG